MAAEPETDRHGGGDEHLRNMHSIARRARRKERKLNERDLKRKIDRKYAALQGGS